MYKNTKQNKTNISKKVKFHKLIFMNASLKTSFWFMEILDYEAEVIKEFSVIELSVSSFT